MTNYRHLDCEIQGSKGISEDEESPSNKNSDVIKMKRGGVGKKNLKKDG